MLVKLSNLWHMIQQNKKISVIVPVYNAEKYLKECLDSLINQTLKEIEIICVNDGSTDNSLTILNEYRRRDARVKVMTKKTVGRDVPVIALSNVCQASISFLLTLMII